MIEQYPLNKNALGQSNTLAYTPEARAALWQRLGSLAERIGDGETRAQYLASWRARFDAAFPAPSPADVDDPILPDGCIVDNITVAERAHAKAIAGEWWRKRLRTIKRDVASVDAGALGWALGRRIAAGLIDEGVIDDLPPEIITQPRFAARRDAGKAKPFAIAAQVLAIRAAAFPLTGFGLAERFRDRHGQNFLYTTAKGWLGWDGRRWRILDQEQNALPAEVIAAVFETVRSVQFEARIIKQTGVPEWSIGEKTIEAYRAAGKLLRDDGLNIGGATWAAHRDWGRALESAGSLDATAKIAKQWLTRPIEEFDTERLAINCTNGTLRFVEANEGIWEPRLDPHRRADRITRLAAPAFDPSATAPLYDRVFKWAQPDKAMRRYLRQWAGYNLTGETGAQILQFWYGKGANGKSTVIDAWAAAMGDYAGTIGIETFLDQGLKKRGDAATPDLAKLGGVRLLRASEPERGAKLNEALIKATTGGEPLSVRALHKGFFDLLPAFKLTMSGNNKPDIPGTDEGIWRRIKLVVWGQFLEADQRDEDLPAKLRGELPGILAWMVRGTCDWLSNGFREPGAVTEATAEYRDDSDPLARFLRACTSPDPGGRVQSSVLHDVFCAWAKAAGEREWSNKGFSQAMKAKGFSSKQSDGMHWLGIGLTRRRDDFVDEHGKVIAIADADQAGDGSPGVSGGEAFDDDAPPW